MSNVPNQQRLVPIAPASGSTTHYGQSNPDTSMPYTCLTCTRRKVKCDKLSPICSTCRKSALDCIYQEPAPRKRKRKPVDEMSERLEHYEKLLKQSGIFPSDKDLTEVDTADLTPISTKSASEDNSRDTLGKTGTLHASQGRTRYINGGIWRNLDDVEDDYQPSSDDEREDDPLEQPTYQSVVRDPLTSSFLSPGSPATNLIEAHPSYEVALNLWDIYVRNVDPVCKVLHVPTTRKKLLRAAANPSSASKATEAVLFAIYNIAIESITEQECREVFKEARSTLQTQYLEAVRQALVNAQFLRTTDLNVVQAFVLFLLSVRCTYDPHTFWVLTGVVVRLGQRLGLHLSSVDGQLNPFDVQIRRRVFWQILPLDGLSSVSSGVGIALPFDAWDTKQPLNINDADIWPDMDHAPEPREGATDMLFCVARTELASFFKMNHRRMTDWAKIWDPADFDRNMEEIGLFREAMEAKYIRFCDITEPHHCLTLLMGRSAENVGKFRINLPRAVGPDATEVARMEQWSVSCKWLDTDAASNQNPLLKGFRWHLNAVYQWEPVIWLLYELRREPARWHTERIWAKIGATFNYHPDVLLLRRALQVGLARLCLKAWDACRLVQPRDSHAVMSSEPPFLASVRDALAKRDGNKQRTPASLPYNAFDAGQDAAEDLPEPNPADFEVAEQAMDFSNFTSVNMDSSDWVFWDQLINEPTTFNVT